MVNFFRIIRSQILENNKTKKYLIYAISEVVLVVTGILLAFQVDQWNNNQKENKALKVLIKNLNNEFINNYKQLDIDLFRLKKKSSASTILLSHTGIKKSKISEFYVDSLLNEAINSPTWNPSSFVLGEIKNSGKLSTIKNKKLKKLLYKWERLYQDILEWHILQEETTKDLADIISNKGSLVNIDYYNSSNRKRSKFNISNLVLLQEIRFENVLENNLFIVNMVEERYNKAKILLKEIIDISKGSENKK